LSRTLGYGLIPKRLNGEREQLPFKGDMGMAVTKAIELADGFSLVTGVAPKGYGNRIPHHHSSALASFADR